VLEQFGGLQEFGKCSFELRGQGRRRLPACLVGTEMGGEETLDLREDPGDSCLEERVLREHVARAHALGLPVVVIYGDVSRDEAEARDKQRHEEGRRSVGGSSAPDGAWGAVKAGKVFTKMYDRWDGVSGPLLGGGFGADAVAPLTLVDRLEEIPGAARSSAPITMQFGERFGLPEALVSMTVPSRRGRCGACRGYFCLSSR
jgi:hypothetical protein